MACFKVYKYSLHLDCPRPAQSFLATDLTLSLEEKKVEDPWKQLPGNNYFQGEVNVGISVADITCRLPNLWLPREQQHLSDEKLTQNSGDLNS